MKTSTPRYTRSLFAAAVAVVLPLAGCPQLLSDFRNSDAGGVGPGGDGGEPRDSGDAGGNARDSAMSTPDVEANADVAVADTGIVDTGALTDAATDVSLADAEAPDTSTQDSSPPAESSAPDTSTVDSASPPDAGGSDACTPVMHMDGVGQSWTDCTPLGTYDEAEAMRACEAYVASTPGAVCDQPPGSAACSGAASCWWATRYGGANNLSMNWAYAGANAGHVVVGTGAIAYCPSSTDSMWE